MRDVEAELVLRDHDALRPRRTSRTSASGGLRVGGEPPRARERLPHLAHGGAGLQQRRAHPAGDEVAEPVAARLRAEQAEPPELQRALRREPQEPGQLPQAEDALGMGGGHASA